MKLRNCNLANANKIAEIRAEELFKSLGLCGFYEQFPNFHTACKMGFNDINHRIKMSDELFGRFLCY